jgi:peptide/nickel transport system permease protein
MKRFLVARVARTVPLVILISIVTFALLHLAPGGPSGIMANNPKATEVDLVRIRASYGLDKPLPVQYLLWFRRVFLRLDFGSSYVTGRPVTEMIRQRIPATLELMGAAFAIALVLGIAMGVASALKRDGVIDQLCSIVSAIGMSVPVFWLGIIVIYLFSLKLGLLPSGGRETIGAPPSLADHLRHLALPVSVLSIAFLASWSRYTRSRFIDAVAGDFVRTARAKGLSERAVIWKHVLRNAAIPVLTVVVMQVPALFTGAVITETVFSWPGMGRMFYEGLERHDYALVLGVVVIGSFLIIVCNLIGDLLCVAIDPRISTAAGFGGARGSSPATARTGHGEMKG